MRPARAESGGAHGALAGFPPGSFAVVMATGIVSIASHLHGLHWIARTLFGLNGLAWIVLCALSLLRLIRYPARFLDDLTSHRNGPAFFTTVAGTAVLGSQFVVLEADYRIATLFWALALASWLALTYAVFAALTVRAEKPALDRGISGTWLLAVVATQSVAVLSALLAARHAQPWRAELNFFALSLWMWGGMLYIWMMSLIFYRYTFFRLSPADLTPPYWINMGAMAISTLAGSLLVLNASEAPFLRSLLPFLEGFTVLYWATGTWWIPMLLVLGVWRYGCKRFPLRYDVSYWGAVFPLGMYAVGTREMAGAMGLGFLAFVPPTFLAVALFAWTLAFAGLVRRIGSAALPVASA